MQSDHNKLHNRVRDLIDDLKEFLQTSDAERMLKDQRKELMKEISLKVAKTVFSQRCTNIEEELQGHVNILQSQLNQQKGFKKEVDAILKKH